MLDTTYCGYVNYLIVVILVSVSLLLIVLFLIILFMFWGQSVILVTFKIFNLNFFGDLEILFNIWRFLFMLIVIIIRRRVIIFSCSYITGLAVSNFIFLYLRFVVSMLWLTLINRFYWIIFGWDGLGVVSFLLIIFYINYERVNNGLFTLFQNRVGDLFFVLFIVGVLRTFIWRVLVLKWGLLFLVIGSCVKRAQFPFNSWLLAAIRAPTPISSLVHSSTLVVAGVYILLQFSYCLYDFLNVLQIIRILSLLFRSFGLLNEFDIKKLIAYSTIRHVSLIMYILGFKLYKVVYFHLNIHAIFKSLIFICFGFVILASFHSQDKRLVLFLNINPLVKIIFYYACLCLAGLPFLSGFFSKDLIIEKFIEFNSEFFYVGLLLVFLSIRIYYRLKLLKLNYLLFSYTMVEKRFLGLFSVFLIGIVIILIVNLYISLMFSLTLELLSFKFIVYIFIRIFLMLRLLTNLHYKVINYDKVKNFIEIWLMDFYLLDKFFFWNIFNSIQYLVNLRKIKLFLLINWWVCVILIVVL